jgi:hypothetical protein
MEEADKGEELPTVISGCKYWDAVRRRNLLPLVEACEALGLEVVGCHPGQSIPAFQRTYLVVRGADEALGKLFKALSFPRSPWAIQKVEGGHRFEWAARGWPASDALQALSHFILDLANGGSAA